MQPEPPHFSKKVQKKGEEFLLQNPHAKGNDLKPYWRKIIPDLHSAYSGICAYTCHWMPYDISSITVEHFKPKEMYPQHAYCWDNYRLVCGRLNGRKGVFEDVLDPFTLQEGWIELHFPSLQLIPGKHLTAIEAQQVDTTVNTRLKLNDGICIGARRGWLTPYSLGKYGIDFLEDMAPFMAKEVKRQKLDDMSHLMWEEYRELEQHRKLKKR
ncbi:MAG TPA: hypothetical protein VN729_00570 [Ktedonobacteraceae bacterium]|nr:hypothetical protein [Ktedonobacteraceae bacterium]